MSKRENVSPSFWAERVISMSMSTVLYTSKSASFRKKKKKNAIQRVFCSYFNKSTLGKSMSKTTRTMDMAWCCMVWYCMASWVDVFGSGLKK